MLQGKIAVVTGANRGIGLASAKFLAQKGANVVLACRSENSAFLAIKDQLRPQMSSLSASLDYLPLDLASLESVHAFPVKFEKRFGKKRPDILINNAGVLLKDRRISGDGLDLTMQTNFISPSLLSLLFLKSNQASATEAFKIINLGAAVHRMVDTDLSLLQSLEGPYDGWKSYCNSKRFQLMLSLLLARQQASPTIELAFLKNTPFKSVSLDPGWVKTSLVRSEHGWNDQDREKKTGGASASADKPLFDSLSLALEMESKVNNGDFIVRGRVSKPGKGIDSADDQQRLWELTKSIIKW